jgi:hypothetical protein
MRSPYPTRRQLGAHPGVGRGPSVDTSPLVPDLAGPVGGHLLGNGRYLPRSRSTLRAWWPDLVAGPGADCRDSAWESRGVQVVAGRFFTRPRWSPRCAAANSPVARARDLVALVLAHDVADAWRGARAARPASTSLSSGRPEPRLQCRSTSRQASVPNAEAVGCVR